MPFLPIVERELRVAARQPSTSLVRFLIALAGIILWLGLLGISHQQSPAHIGRSLFSVLTFPLFAWCLLAGVFLTADCLSVEKREGTLGLLFLTDLRGYDVVLGKLASTSLKGGFALVAALPVLALPLLLGGVTGAEFWRTVLALLTTLALSLTGGLFMSALTRQSRVAICGTFLFLLVLTAMPLASLVVFGLRSPTYPLQLLFWLSPAFLLRTSAGHWEFWPSFFVNITMAIGFLGAACSALPRSWRDRARPLKVRRARTRLRDFRNPYSWLARRGQPALWLVWGSMILGAAVTIGLMIDTHLSTASMARMSGGGSSFAIGVLTAFAAHQLFKCMVVAEATRCFSEHRHNGIMELLLVSPVSPVAIINGQRRALASLFRTPAWTLVALNMVLIFTHHLIRSHGPQYEVWVLALAGGMLLLVADYYGLSWTGMWLGLRSRRRHRAMLGTFLRVMLPPWTMAVLLFFGWGRGRLGLEEMMICWIFLGAALSLMIGQFAQIELRRQFRAIVRRDVSSDAVMSRCPVQPMQPFELSLKGMGVEAPDKTVVR
jgi:ABC-type transport system involved in multi-copper enzyme maturation permease subunit